MQIKKLPCSLGKMVIKEQERLEADLEKQGLDPRLTSRSPNASNPVVTKSRYKSPINACTLIIFMHSIILLIY